MHPKYRAIKCCCCFEPVFEFNLVATLARVPPQRIYKILKYLRKTVGTTTIVATITTGSSTTSTILIVRRETI